jgi:hypothetical protein
MTTALEEKKSRLALIHDLRASPAYLTILLPHFQSLATHHAQQCRNKSLPWEKRAEHIEAADLADHLLTYLDDRAATLQSQIEALRNERTTDR